MNKLEPNKQRAENAIFSIRVVLVLEIICLIGLIYYYDQYSLLWTVDQVSIEIEIISIIYFFARIISAVMFIKWFKRAYSNLHQKVTDLLHTEDSAIYYWFIIGMNLYKPYNIMKELYCKTGELLIEKGILSKESPLPPHSLSSWWILWLIRNYAFYPFIFVFYLFIAGTTTDLLITSILVNMILNILGIPLALITIKIIKDYSKMESLLYMVNEEGNEEKIINKGKYLLFTTGIVFTMGMGFIVCFSFFGLGFFLVIAIITTIGAVRIMKIEQYLTLTKLYGWSRILRRHILGEALRMVKKETTTKPLQTTNQPCIDPDNSDAQEALENLKKMEQKQ